MLPGLFPVSGFLLSACAARAECRPSAVVVRTSRVTSARGCLHPSFVRILLQKAEEPQQEDDDGRHLLQERRHTQRCPRRRSAASGLCSRRRLGLSSADKRGYLTLISPDSPHRCPRSSVLSAGRRRHRHQVRLGQHLKRQNDANSCSRRGACAETVTGGRPENREESSPKDA